MLQRVQKIISNAGFCSRRKAEELIEKGMVNVNRKTIKLGDKADPETDKITINNKPLKIENKIYILLYKPKAYLCTLSSPSGRRTVKDLLKGVRQRVYPVGRLDNQAEGLLLLTNDGDFANFIMHPSNRIKKTYLARINKDVLPGDIERLRKGIMIDNTKVIPDKVSVLEASLIQITLHQGLNRVVKRLFEAMDYKIYALMRIKTGSLDLTGVKRGHYRYIKQAELESLGYKK